MYECVPDRQAVGDIFVHDVEPLSGGVPKTGTSDAGVHLEQRVLPEAPVRHWTCSLPWGLRELLGYDKRLCADVLAAVIAELGRSLKWRAKKLLPFAPWSSTTARMRS